MQLDFMLSEEHDLATVEATIRVLKGGMGRGYCCKSCHKEKGWKTALSS